MFRGRAEIACAVTVRAQPRLSPLQRRLAAHQAFDSGNFDRAYAGTSNTGIWYTSDGGRTWVRAQVASSVSGQNHNFFSIAVSPVDAQTVWAAGLDLGEENVQPGSGRHIYVSKDAGKTFTVALSMYLGLGIVQRCDPFACP